MSVRKLLPIVLLLAAVSIRCSGSPSEPEGVVIVTQTTTTTTTTSTTTTVIPAVVGGSVGASPSSGLAGATVFSFFVSAPPTGGVPPFVFTWNFGDGQEGAGAAPTHLYAIPGSFVVRATATDSRGMTVQMTAAVTVGTVTGRWIATFPPGDGLNPSRSISCKPRRRSPPRSTTRANSLDLRPAWARSPIRVRWRSARPSGPAHRRIRRHLRRTGREQPVYVEWNGDRLRWLSVRIYRDEASTPVTSSPGRHPVTAVKR